MVQPLWKTVWKFLKKLKIVLPCEKKKKILIRKDTCTPVLIAPLFIIAKT